ncbi:MAG: alpha/beta fold hydrolase [Acidobacteriota bacterium]|nr:alpha/beta fold hydrolase [Acidobacteriota bacterium]
MRRFEPLFTNPHILTILGNFWPRTFDFTPYPVESQLFETEPGVQVLVQTQRPRGTASAAIVIVHGLEGSGEAGYVRTISYAALQAGFIVHRFHMRTCGGTERLCQTLYHAGLTSDLLAFLTSLVRQGTAPIFLVGFSLGGNVVLKLAGELGEDASSLISGVCSISAPIDLAACARRMGRIDNRLYERRFVKRMRKRVFATGRYKRQQLEARSLYAFDDRVTAPSFGFRGADHYYATQSAIGFLDGIRLPTLMIQAKDDTFIPFKSYDHPAFRNNPFLQLIATEHGGHLGFLSRKSPRFWVDGRVIDWITEQLGKLRAGR